MNWPTGLRVVNRRQTPSIQLILNVIEDAIDGEPNPALLAATALGLSLVAVGLLATIIMIVMLSYGDGFFLYMLAGTLGLSAVSACLFHRLTTIPHSHEDKLLALLAAYQPRSDEDYVLLQDSVRNRGYIDLEETLHWAKGEQRRERLDVLTRKQRPDGYAAFVNRKLSVPTD